MANDTGKLGWKDYLALSMVLFAVASTIAWYKDSGHSTTALLSQAQATNAWGHYQSKSVKANLYAVGKERLELDARLNPAGQSLYQEQIQIYDSHIKRYDEERKELENQAREQEQIRDLALRYSNAFGLAMMMLQIAIVFASLASLLDKKLFWIASLLVGCVGAVYFANGWWLFF